MRAKRTIYEFAPELAFSVVCAVLLRVFPWCAIRGTGFNYVVRGASESLSCFVVGGVHVGMYAS